jgi:hypothetical protein
MFVIPIADITTLNISYSDIKSRGEGRIVVVFLKIALFGEKAVTSLVAQCVTNAARKLLSPVA